MTSSQKWIQCEVLSTVGAVSYIVALGGHQRKVHVDHLLRRVPQRVADGVVQFPGSSNIEPLQLPITRWEPQFVSEEVHLPRQQGELLQAHQQGRSHLLNQDTWLRWSPR